MIETSFALYGKQPNKIGLDNDNDRQELNFYHSEYPIVLDVPPQPGLDIGPGSG